MASPSRKRKAITLKTKYEIIQSVQKEDSQKKTSQVNSEFHQTLKYNFKKNKDLIVASYENSDKQITAHEPGHY